MNNPTFPMSTFERRDDTIYHSMGPTFSSILPVFATPASRLEMEGKLKDFIFNLLLEAHRHKQHDQTFMLKLTLLMSLFEKHTLLEWSKAMQNTDEPLDGERGTGDIARHFEVVRKRKQIGSAAAVLELMNFLMLGFVSFQVERTRAKAMELCTS